MSRSFIVRADYTVRKELVVTVKDGESALDPRSWVEVTSERDLDCTLLEVHEAEVNE